MHRQMASIDQLVREARILMAVANICSSQEPGSMRQRENRVDAIPLRCVAGTFMLAVKVRSDVCSPMKSRPNLHLNVQCVRCVSEVAPTKAVVPV